MRSLSRAVRVVRPLAIGIAAAAAPALAGDDLPPLRAPAVPIVTHNPYFSAWSGSEKLTDSWVKHWTNSAMAVCGLVRIDGKPFRFAGTLPSDVAVMEQTSLEITATASVYTFRAEGLELTLRFRSPVLASDADLASRAVTYVTLSARSLDAKAHDVRAYLDCSGEWCTHDPAEMVRWSRARIAGREWVGLGAAEGKPLAHTGDWRRADWGTLYLGPVSAENSATGVGGHSAMRGTFASTGSLPQSDDLRQPRAANDDWPVIAGVLDLSVNERTPREATLALAYDDGVCAEYFNRPLKPYWARSGKGFAQMLEEGVANHAAIEKAAAEFDAKLRADLIRVGGGKYARLCELAYRQVMAAHIIATDFDGTMLMLSKENTSNGCIATVDVTFPSSPFFLLFNPKLLEAQIEPVLDYSDSPRWRFDFAPHDLGTYPKANGQVYGGGERTEENQMPVEECGNLLILAGALAQADGNTAFAERHWATLTRWANYLAKNGLDPANQLCTDDFAGHLARNANLSIKAILGIGAYADLCKRRGLTEDASRWRTVAEEDARKWQDLSRGNETTVLAFGRPDTWSLKYNLFWDRALSLKLFPEEIARRELELYLKKANKFGVPLDSRDTYTKTDFLVWAGALTGRREDLDAIIAPIFDFANATPDRVAFTDWYRTTDARTMGMHTRSVIGGIYAPMLNSPEITASWRKRAR
ncbi:MAG: DUF4965 domain-containing protein [Phycisphaerales bacterium]